MVILPVLRHLTSSRDAVVAGLIAGPLAMLPAILFFVCMIAFYPAIGAETLPSDFLLRQLNQPLFHWAFQIMIFAALLESGAGAHQGRRRFWRAGAQAEAASRAGGEAGPVQATVTRALAGPELFSFVP